ncbi:PREDICTED: uncharacterized protein F54F2.9-like [Priapulus caudatus]|uniref:Uncharacterized protein F54F2.9-like n=1 Tax=Priapulus caudatus TaxID=37621 RepID=A0ABM1EGN1_PRICU|nr:PREDICTED: uncharacterized protein F54F2.9-like [Priapulus caudatus]
MKVYRSERFSVFVVKLLFCTLALAKTAHCWDTEYIQLLDLVEEIKDNFYDVLGVDQTISIPELKRAYRKLTLIWHPDKNKDENAEEMFRKITSVHEILKNEKTRQQYDDILKNGLPNWRQPVYYYRKARKLGLLEIAILLVAIITVGQYIVAWAAYWERKFELQEALMTRRQRTNKKKMHAEIDEVLEMEMKFIPRPSLWNLLVVHMVSQSVSGFHKAVDAVKQWRERRNQPAEDPVQEPNEDDSVSEKVRVKRPRAYVKDVSPTEMVEMTPVAVTEMPTIADGAVRESNKTTQWTDADFAQLCKLMVKYPIGIYERWEKIAMAMHRDTDDVICHAKQLRSRGYSMNVTNSMQGITGTEGHSLVRDDQLETYLERSHSEHVQTQSAPNGSSLRIRKMKPREAETAAAVSGPCSTNDVSQQQVAPAEVQSRSTSKLSGDSAVEWTRPEQKLLECALVKFPKGTPDRWMRIAEAVPSKKPDHCMARYKLLAEMVRKKKQQHSS